MAEGILFVLTGPSGVGKGTVQKQVREQKQLFFSVSATTRAPRPGETDGVEYHFMTREAFEEQIRQGGFLEHAEYNGNLYGTPAASVQATLNEGRDVLLEIEVEGAMQVRHILPQAVRIFLAPPSFEELERRLTGRGTESDAEIQNRLERARYELSLAPQFDYIVVNRTVEQAVMEVLAIMRAEACRADRVRLD